MTAPVPPTVAVLPPLALEDLDALMAVQRDGAIAGHGHIFPQETHPFPEQWVLDQWKRELADPGVDCFVIKDAAAKVAGFAATRAEELLHFGTALSTWGTGLADLAHTELLDTAGSHADHFPAASEAQTLRAPTPVTSGSAGE